MNKEFAIEILEMVERHTLEHTSALAKEAFRYLERLKISADIKDRIYRVKNR